MTGRPIATAARPMAKTPIRNSNSQRAMVSNGSCLKRVMFPSLPAARSDQRDHAGGGRAEAGNDEAGGNESGGEEGKAAVENLGHLSISFIVDIDIQYADSVLLAIDN